MPEETAKLKLINGARINVRFIWLFGAGQGPSYYPQAVRASPSKAEALRHDYNKMEPFYARKLAAFVPVSQTILAPQSRYPFAETYRDACKTNGVMDISTRFKKLLGSKNAGEDGTTPDDIYRSLSYSACGDESGISSVTLVDDVVARGKTATAIFSHLVDAGMPCDSEFTVASLLRIRTGLTNP